MFQSLPHRIDTLLMWVSLQKTYDVCIITGSIEVAKKVLLLLHATMYCSDFAEVQFCVVDKPLIGKSTMEVSVLGAGLHFAPATQKMGKVVPVC